MTDSVQFTESVTASGALLGAAHLHMPGSLNALTLEAVDALTAQLLSWRDRVDIAAVILTGEGPKAFCAGGDVQALYRAAKDNLAAGTLVNDYPARFFANEYRLDFLLHRFPKPVICLGHGIVMGGGYGLFSAASVRVLTERSRLAFPEITIGLFPDAGGTWVLKNLPVRVAAFLGMTGSQVNAEDALALGIGTHLIEHETREQVISGLTGLKWQVGSVADAARHNQAIAAEYFAAQATPKAVPESELAKIDLAGIALESAQECVDSILALDGSSEWASRGVSNLRGGCPVTAAIVFEQLQRLPQLTLAESFRMEYAIATECLRRGDFVEGVRALLVDKDRQPMWSVANVAEVTAEVIDAHFADNADAPGKQRLLAGLD